MKPIMVSRSMGWKMCTPKTESPSFISQSAVTLPTVASGSASSTSRLSMKDRNSAAISRNRMAMASRKLPPISLSAVSSLSAVPV